MMDYACSRMRLRRNTYSLLVGETDGKGPLRRPRIVEIIKMELKERS
jgi:hypothetical protein